MKIKNKNFSFNSATAAKYFIQTKATFFHFSKLTGKKLQDFKAYIKSNNFEEDLDLLIMNLQWFDPILEVPNLNRLKRAQRVFRKIQLIRNSFFRLNAEGAGVGALFGGPQGATVGAGFVTGSFALIVATILYDRATSSYDHAVQV